MQYLYLLINIACIAGPFALSFDKKVAFFRSWKNLFASIILMMLVFIPWDIAFTINKIWGFNPSYLSGFSLFNLPIEEWLFFVTVPYACIFIYACVCAYFPGSKNLEVNWLILVLAIFCLIIGVLNLDKWYTAINFIGCSIILILNLVSKTKNQGTLLIGYLIGLIPFLIVNGLLTGTGIESEIVWYNNDENLGLRILTIPVEDAFYFMFFYYLVGISFVRMSEK